MSRYQGQWGGGNRGGGGWGGGGGRGGYSGGGGGGGRGGGQQNNADFKETVRVDRSVAERPKWQLTCYGHEREGPNDISGDISPEEVRWANMVSAERGAPMIQLINELKAAEKAKVEQFQTLQKVHRAPSKGGQPIPPPTATVSNLEWIESGTYPGSSGVGTMGGSAGFGSSPFGQQAAAATRAPAPFGVGASATASPFGQPGPAFGQQPALAATMGTSPFGQPAAFGGGGSLGQPAPSIGGASGGGFGGAFGAASSSGTIFGSNNTSGGSAFGAPKPAFGQQAAAPSSTPFGAGAGATTTGGFKSAFGGGTALSSGTSTGGFGSAFGAPSTVGSSAPVFGQATGFGQAAPAAASSLFSNAPAIAATTTTAAPFGSQAQPTQPFGGVFGAKAPSTLPFGAFGVAAAQPLAVEVQQAHQSGGTAEGAPPVDPGEAAAWEASVFEKGKIPENAPPPVYCR